MNVTGKKQAKVGLLLALNVRERGGLGYRVREEAQDGLPLPAPPLVASFVGTLGV